VKICSGKWGCGRELDSEEFYIANSICKDCKKLANKKTQARNQSPTKKCRRCKLPKDKRFFVNRLCGSCAANTDYHAKKQVKLTTDLDAMLTGLWKITS